jgi:hypothetical protein
MLAIVVALGVWGYSKVVRPNRSLLGDLAEAQLRQIFGEGVTYDHFHIDLVDGVVIHGLQVRGSQRDQAAFEARRVELRHDLVALAAGTYRPVAIVIDGARIATHETPTGIALDFPFDLTPSSARNITPPKIEFRGSRLLYRAMDDSPRLLSRYVLILDKVDLKAQPEADGGVRISGGFNTEGLGQNEVRIDVFGSANPVTDELELDVAWNPIYFTPELLGVLADEMAAPIRQSGVSKGQLYVTITSRPDENEGALKARVGLEGRVQMDLDTIPGAEFIDARTREQLTALFGRVDLSVEFSEGGIDIHGLTTGLGEGNVNASGRISEDGEEIDLLIEVANLRLEDPAIRDALGEAGREIYNAFEPGGRVDASIRLVKERHGDLDWDVDALLEDARFRYVGTSDVEGEAEGFPYPVQQAAGRIRITPGIVRFDDIVGFNGGATVRLLGDRHESWTGGETGVIRFTDEGTDVRLTVRATDVPVDHDLRAAVDGSEFAGLLETFQLEGVVDRIEVDIVQVAGKDEVAYTEARITLEENDFRYAPFPLPLDHVAGWITYRRPFLPEGGRGIEFAFNVSGRADGAATRAEAVIRGHDDAGRLLVRGEGVPLAGELARTILDAEDTRDGLGVVWRYLDPRGFADVEISFPIEEDPEPLRLTADLRNASVRLDAAEAPHPLEIDDLKGRIAVVGDRVALEGLRGRLAGSDVRFGGVVDGGTEGRWEIDLQTDVLRVTPELLGGVRYFHGDGEFLPAGLRLESGGRLALALRLRREAGPDQPLEADVSATALDATLRLPEGGTLSVRGEKIQVTEAGVVVEGVTAQGPGITAEIAQGSVLDDRLSGRVVLHLEDFRASESLLALLSEGTREDLMPWMEDRLLSTDRLELEAREDGGFSIDGDLRLHAVDGAPLGGAPRGNLEFRPVEVSAPRPDGSRRLRGRALFHGLSLGDVVPVDDLFGQADIEFLDLGEEASGVGVLRASRARISDLRVRDVTVPVNWQEGILRAGPVTGTLAEGRLRGRLALHTRAPGGYEGEASVDAFSLAALRDDLAPTGPAYSGTGNAQISFQNRGSDARGLTAAGTVTVRQGNLGDLPIVANIFTLLSGLLGMEEPPQFERADIDFFLRDEVVQFRRLDLAGPLFDLPGTGTLDLGGLVDLTFTPDIIKSLAVPGVMQLPGIGDLLDVLLREDLLYEIRLRGDIASADTEIVAFPPLGLGEDRPFEGTGTPRPLPRRIPRWFR